jgi:predicted SprT family Zn-dependent metalloprotease
MEKHHIPQLLKLGNEAGVIIWRKMQYIFPKLTSFNCPKIIINNRLKTSGGRADGTNRIIELSAEMFFYNQKEYLFTVIPHEMAHIVNKDLNQLGGHGREWKDIMIAYGLKPLVFHTMTNPMQVKRTQARKLK